MTNKLNPDTKIYLSDIVGKSNENVRVNIAKNVENVYREACRDISLNEYTLKILECKFDRIEKLYVPIFPHKEESEIEKADSMFHQTYKSLDSILKQKEIVEGKRFNISPWNNGLLSEFDKEHAGILNDWVEFLPIYQPGFEGSRSDFGYSITINPEGLKVLKDLEKYIESNWKHKFTP